MNDKTKLFGASERRTLSLAAIRRQDGTQVREALDADAVRDYAERYREGETLPPVDVFEDPQSRLLRLANGFHRCKAADVAPLDEIEANVYQGDLRAARLFAATCNAEHGVRRTEETVRTAVLTFLKDEECGTWTDRRIAAAVSCSPTTVGKHRAKLEAAAEEAAQRGQQKGLFGEESPAAEPPKKPKRKTADGREIDPEKASRAKLEERIAAANKEAERCGRVDAADAPRSRHEVMKAIKEAVGVDVPDHAQVGIYRAYEEARLLEQRERARTAAEAQAQPTTYRPILGGDAAEALGGKPLRTAADVRIAELEAEVAELKERLEETEAAADDQDAALGEGVETFEHNQARIAELEARLDNQRTTITDLERDLRLAEQRFRREQEVNTALLTAITRTAALWRGEHDGPRAQLLALLEEQGQQDAAAQWDRALQRAAALGRHEGAAALDTIGEESAKLMEQVADLQKQLGAAKEDARLLRQQVQELEQDAAARRQRARQVLCEEPDCGRYTEAPQGGGLALCDHHRPGVPLRPWREVYPLSASAPELLECPKTWEDLGAALVMCTAGWGGDMLADAETLAAAAIEKGLDGEEVNLRADLRPAELAALLRGVERELKTPTSGPWSAEAQNDDLEPPRGKGPCNTRCLATTPEGGARGHRYCTRDLGHDDRHRYEEPDNDETREKIEKVLAARRQAQEASAKPAPKGRKARAPKAEPAPAPPGLDGLSEGQRTAFHRALHGFSGSAERWATLRQHGASDAELRAAIGSELGIAGSSSGPGRPTVEYDLRHICASHLLQGSWGRRWTLEEVRDFLGHSSITVTQRYAHLDQRRLHKGGKNPQIVIGEGADALTLKGATLVAMVRAYLQIPPPQTPTEEHAPAPQAQAEPPPPPAAAPTWTPASIGGAAAVHAVATAALDAALAPDADERHPAALCKQRPNYKSGWTPRAGAALTCKGCLRAVEVPRG